MKSIRRYIEDEGIPLVRVKRGQRKEDIAREHLKRFKGDQGVVFVGCARKKPSCFERNGGAGQTRERFIRGSFVPPQWSITSTSTAWTRISGCSFSSSARTSLTRPSCASMVMSMPSVNSTSVELLLRGWTSAFCRARIRSFSSTLATNFLLSTSERSSRTGLHDYRIRIHKKIRKPGRCMMCPCCKPNLTLPRPSTVP